jgi:hypothetical protein
VLQIRKIQTGTVFTSTRSDRRTKLGGSCIQTGCLAQTIIVRITLFLHCPQLRRSTATPPLFLGTISSHSAESHKSRGNSRPLQFLKTKTARFREALKPQKLVLDIQVRAGNILHWPWSVSCIASRLSSTRRVITTVRRKFLGFTIFSGCSGQHSGSSCAQTLLYFSQPSVRAISIV